MGLAFIWNLQIRQQWETLLGMLDGFETVSEWIEEEKNFDKYILTDTEQEKLEAF